MTQPLSQRLLILRDRFGMMFDDLEVMNEAVELAKRAETSAVLNKGLIDAAESVAWNARMTAPDDTYHEVSRGDMDALIAAIALVTLEEP